MTVTRVTEPAVIFVRFEQVGFHCWPDAPSHRAYLRASHRHLFGIEVTTHVDHDERDIEPTICVTSSGAVPRLSISSRFRPQSCETLARRPQRSFRRRARHRIVSEDGECGARSRSAPD
jgi:hypothetical protein